MASYVRYTASGITNTFAVPFAYLDKTHTKLYRNGVLQSASLYTWPTTSSIQITAGNPSVGTLIELRRETPITPLVTFVAGNLAPLNLNKAAKQPLYLAQEAWDGWQDLLTRGWLTAGYAAGGTITKGLTEQLLKFDASGNVVPGNTASEIIAAAKALGSSIGNNPFYHAVADGGADNTGVTSAKAALQTALNVATAAGKPLLVPAGIYKFNAGERLIPPSNSVIIGMPGATFRKVTDEAISIIYVAPGGTTTKVRIKGLTFEYTAATTLVQGGANAAIYLIDCKDVIVEDCLATGKFYVGFNISDGSEYTFKDCKAYGFVNRGFYINAGQGGTGSGTLKHVKVLNCLANGLDGGTASDVGRYGFNTNAFGTATGIDIMFDNCVAIGCYGHGFSASERLIDCRFVNCHVECTNIEAVNFIIQFANTFRAAQNVMVGCTSKGGFHGFSITEADDTVIMGCRATGANQDGWYIHNSKYLDLIGCQSNSNGLRGFDIDATASGDSDRVTFVACTARLNVAHGFFSTANVLRPKAVACGAVGNGTDAVTFGDAATRVLDNNN